MCACTFVCVHVYTAHLCVYVCVGVHVHYTAHLEVKEELRASSVLLLCGGTPVVRVGAKSLDIFCHLAGPVSLLNGEGDLVNMGILCYFMRSRHLMEKVAKATTGFLADLRPVSPGWSPHDVVLGKVKALFWQALDRDRDQGVSSTAQAIEGDMSHHTSTSGPMSPRQEPAWAT